MSTPRWFAPSRCSCCPEEAWDERPLGNQHWRCNATAAQRVQRAKCPLCRGCVVGRSEHARRGGRAGGQGGGGAGAGGAGRAEAGARAGLWVWVLASRTLDQAHAQAPQIGIVVVRLRASPTGSRRVSAGHSHVCAGRGGTNRRRSNSVLRRHRCLTAPPHATHSAAPAPQKPCFGSSLATCTFQFRWRS